MYVLAIAAALCASVIYGYIALCRARAKMAGLPKPPVKYWWLGNVDIMIKAAMLFPSDVHPQHIFNYIKQKYDMPQIWYMDLWPVSGSFLFSDDPVYTSRYATTGQSLPKSRASSDYLDAFLGPQNLVTAEGGHWKSLRAIFNPGFSAAHLMTLVPYIVDSSLVFVDVLRKKAETHELFQLEEYATRLTIDIIGKVTLDADFDSQKRDHPLVTAFRERTPLMYNGTRPLQLLNDIEFLRKYKLRQNGYKLDALVGKEIDRTIAKRGQGSSGGDYEPGKKVAFKDRKRSIVDLALDAYYSDKMVSSTGGSVKPSKEMDAAFRAEAITSVKTFIFAGHDTTSSTIAYALYLLHHHPSVQCRLMNELRNTFGSPLTTTSIATAIKNDPHLINSLTYTNAILKEVLRIFPAASTLRMSPSILPGNNGNQPLSVPNINTEAPYNSPAQLPLFGRDLTFWPIALLCHRNKTYFPEPESFIPERFIPELTPFPDAKLHTKEGAEAFRAFEKGPRGCIGEQLAVIETKVILALVVGSGFDFVAELADGEKAACGPAKSTVVDTDAWAEMVKGGDVPQQKSVSGGTESGLSGRDFIKPEDLELMRKWKGRTVEGYGIYQKLLGAAKPAFGMPGRIYLKEDA